MSHYNNNNNRSRTKTFYEILEVDPTADQATIRKAYLRKSLKYHPDKNPSNPEEAKARFVEIGMAYETLGDETKRRVYDRELRSRRGAGGFSFGGSGSGGSGTHESSSGFQQQQQQQSGGSEHGYEFSDANFDNYRDAFDATVAGMSEEDLAAAVGAVSALAGIVGGMAGSFLMSRKSGKNGSGSHGARGGSGGGGGGGSGGLLVAAGSMIGATVATEIAAASVRSLHRDSIQRIQYKEDCRVARDRGQPLPEPPRTSFFGKQLGEALKKGVRTMAGLDDEEKDDENKNQGNGHGSNGRNSNGNGDGNGYNENGKNNDNGSKGSNFWKMAAEAVREAKAAQAANRR